VCVPRLQQAVQMLALSNSLALQGATGQLVPLDHGDGVVELRKHAGAKQASHACPQDNRTIAELSHTHLLVARSPQSAGAASDATVRQK